MSLPVLYRDDALVVVDKPAGLVVHRGWAQDEVTALALVRDLVGQWVYPVHRLDRGTSGVLIFARSAEVAGRLGEAFAGEGVHKRYLALVRGHAPESVLVDHALAKEPGKPKQPAQTRVARLESHPVVDAESGIARNYSWLEARPLSGRAHQIRRHLKHINHPVIGDVRYGKAEHNRMFRRRFGLERLALHAEQVSLEHPLDGSPLVVRAPLPAELAGVLDALRGGAGALRPELHSELPSQAPSCSTLTPAERATQELP